MPADPTHRHDEFHRGKVPEDQLGTGTATDGFVLTATATGEAAWEASAGGGGSVTVEETDGSPAEANVTVIRVGAYTDNGTGDVTLFPQIVGTGTGDLEFDTAQTILRSPDSNQAISLTDAGDILVDAPDAGILLDVGSDLVAMYLERLSATRMKVSDGLHGNHIELTDNSSSQWKHVSEDGDPSIPALGIPRKLTTTERDALTPVAGELIYNTDDDVPQFFDGTDWIDLFGTQGDPGPPGPSGSWTSIFKTADEDKNTTSAVADDSELVVTLSANTAYSLRLRAFFLTNSTADLKYRLVFTGTTTRVRRRVYRTATSDTAQTIELKTAFDGSDVVLSTTGSNPWLEEHVVLQVGASGGDFKLQWSQVTSNAGPTTCLEGSYLEWALN